jgi:hypothetical protein
MLRGAPQAVRASMGPACASSSASQELAHEADGAAGDGQHPASAPPKTATKSSAQMSSSPSASTKMNCTAQFSVQPR